MEISEYILLDKKLTSVECGVDLGGLDTEIAEAEAFAAQLRLEGSDAEADAAVEES